MSTAAKQQHSTTPWRIVSADGYDVAQFRGEWDRKKAPSNAKLMLAAPDLLEAAELALKLFQQHIPDAPEIQVIRAAVDKAKGRDKRKLVN